MIYEYVMSWMARMIQFPGQQGEVAIVLKGIEGLEKALLPAPSFISSVSMASPSATQSI